MEPVRSFKAPEPEVTREERPEIHRLHCPHCRTEFRVKAKRGAIHAIEEATTLSSEEERLEAVARLAARHYGLRTASLYGLRQSRTVSRARGLAMWLMHRHLKRSSPEVGRRFDRDHSTVLIACNRVEKLMREDRQFAHLALRLASRARAIFFGAQG
jgi:chromosomal replication initiation ATPase DnaA